MFWTVAGKLVTGAKVLCPPSSESFLLVADNLVPTEVEEAESEDEDMEEPDVTDLESAAELDSETEPLKASSWLVYSARSGRNSTNVDCCHD